MEPTVSQMARAVARTPSAMATSPDRGVVERVRQSMGSSSARFLDASSLNNRFLKSP